jgi:drug/metabolite transporter (DMT)-like permease
MMTARDARFGGTMASSELERDPSAANGEHSPTLSQSRNRRDLRAYVYVVLMVLLGSTTAAAAKIAVADLPVSVVPAMRFGLAGLCLMPWVWWRRDALTRMIRQDGLLLLLTAALCVPINQGFFLSAARLGPTSHVGIFYATCPLIVLMLAWLTRMERPDRARLWGVLASVAGIVIVGLGNFWSAGAATTEAVSAVLLADLLLVGAVLSWGGYIAASKPLVARHGAMPVLAGTFLFGSLLSVPVALWAWPGWSTFSNVSTSAWLALGVLALFITPFGWAFQNLSLRRFDASQVATFSNAAPALTVVWGVWLFDELVTPALALGGTLAMGGIYWACRSRPVSTAPHAIRSERRGREDYVSSDRRCIGARLALSQESAAQ